MSYESGLGSNSVPYEYSVDVKNKKQKLKKVAFFMVYAVYVILILVIGATVKIILPLLAFIPVSTWIMVWLTWKYTQLSYEYSFFKGEITVNRVYGTNKKSVFANVKIKALTALYCFNGMDGKAISDISADEVIFAARSEQVEKLAALIWTNAENKKVALFIELDEKALKIIHYYNSSII